ncbi:predicted GPI-anchored protein 58, partial [Penaeus monodon]|uniref:predicted GPI-anchored protein 58 n=1 Tax=Penaeus monodon TaxID=6687 RepID=UPI0018A7C286
DVVGESGDARWLPGVGVIDYVPASNRSSVRVSLILPEEPPAEASHTPSASPHTPLEVPSPSADVLPTPEDPNTASSYLSPSTDAPTSKLRRASQDTTAGLLTPTPSPSSGPFSSQPADSTPESTRNASHPITTWLSITTEIRKATSLSQPNKHASKTTDSASTIKPAVSAATYEATSESLTNNALLPLRSPSVTSPLSPADQTPPTAAPSFSSHPNARRHAETPTALTALPATPLSRPSPLPPAAAGQRQGGPAGSAVDSSPSCQSSSPRRSPQVALPQREATGRTSTPSGTKRKCRPTATAM